MRKQDHLLAVAQCPRGNRQGPVAEIHRRTDHAPPDGNDGLHAAVEGEHAVALGNLFDRNPTNRCRDLGARNEAHHRARALRGSDAREFDDAVCHSGFGSPTKHGPILLPDGV